jgi:4-amino-4-deoxy-L-arabinose transferase-like glycosyltransferase
MRAAVLITCFFAITTFTLLGARPLWLDEILQLIETRDPSLAQMIDRLPRNSGAAPLGYVVQHFSLNLTGYSVPKSRLPAALFGILTVLAVALLAAQLHIRHNLLAPALFAMFPQTLRYATESRVYSQALFFAVVSTSLYVAVAKRPTLVLAAGYCLALTLAVYTYPYAICVGLAHLAWSALNRELKTASYGYVGFAFAAVAFLPWYLWSRERWSLGIAREGFHFSFSGRTALMLFREMLGAGYWGSALLVILCLVTLAKRCHSTRVTRLLLLLIGVPVVCVLMADAATGYFIATRQFLWIVPAISILGAMAVERRVRTSIILYVLLSIVCIWYNIQYFRDRREDWQAAASLLSRQIHQGACLTVAPAEHARFYEFFYPDLGHAICTGSESRVALAITPVSTDKDRELAITSLQYQGYEEQQETMIGKSDILLFQH